MPAPACTRRCADCDRCICGKLNPRICEKCNDARIERMWQKDEKKRQRAEGRT